MKELIEEYGEDSYTIIIGQMQRITMITEEIRTYRYMVSFKIILSSHVVILHNNPPLEILEAAAIACKDSTKYRNIRNLKVLYTKYNNVQKTNVPGAVNFKSNRKVQELKL